MTIIWTAIVLDELDGIWQWNAGRYGADHANEYLRELKLAIDDLKQTHLSGKVVFGRRDLRYQRFKRKARGHGHILVYKVEGAIITVLRIFHTAQDWRKALP